MAQRWAYRSVREADARVAIGSVVVDLTPGPIKEWAIQTPGFLDKLFVAVVLLVVIATIAAIAGTLETQRRVKVFAYHSISSASWTRRHSFVTLVDER